MRGEPVFVPIAARFARFSPERPVSLGPLLDLKG